MSSFGKDVLQQLGQMSGAAEQFIIMGYGSSVISAAGGAVVADLAAGPSDSILFGTRYQGNAALLNSADELRIGFSQIGPDQFQFRIGGDWIPDWINGGHINLWPWW
jgi:hypothetical protein